MNREEFALEYLRSVDTVFKMSLQKKIMESAQGKTFVLRYIAHNKGDMQPGEISEVMGISNARITATLNNLEKNGLVTRRIDPDDRRKVLVGLTSAGEDWVEKYNQIIAEGLSRIFDFLGEYDAKEFIRITAKLATMELIFDKL